MGVVGETGDVKKGLMCELQQVLYWFSVDTETHPFVLMTSDDLAFPG